MERLLLEVSGRWRRIRRNETPVTPGWEGLFSEVASFRDVGEGMFCNFRLSYKRLDFEMFSKGVVEAASRFDFEGLIEEVMGVVEDLPVHVVELGVFMQQVAAAAVLSEHKVVKAVLKGEEATLTKPRFLTPREIFRAVYEPPQSGETRLLRLAVGSDVWSLIEKTTLLGTGDLTPREGRMLLNGDREKLLELKTYLALL